MVTRKGSLKPSDVPIDVLDRLNLGTIETVNLAECLAVDFATLMAQVVPELATVAKSRIQPTDGITKRMAVTGQLLLEYVGAVGVERLAVHPSDTVRGWAAYLLAAIPDRSLEQRLMSMRSLADDNHFGVREWSWLAVRPYIADRIDEAIPLLIPWVSDRSPNIRRFAIEVTRQLPNQLVLLVAPKITWSINYEFRSTISAKFIQCLQQSRARNNYLRDAPRREMGEWGRRRFCVWTRCGARILD